MDKTGVCSSIRNTTKTDLALLLKCLKFQMKCPDLQKQALLTIRSICENREDNVDLLREMGGVVFVYNLSKSSIVHADVKEAALYTLSTLVEANVYCKNSLCRKETFADLGRCLMNDDNPLTQKRVSVYLLTVLVANNKLGQTLAQNTGCLDILLDLFRTTFPLSTDSTSVVASPTHLYHLWLSVSIALGGCINNPQNEEGQHICVAAFPMVKTWLQQIALQRTDVFNQICSFIRMTVSNNTPVQEHFATSGGLETLALSLVRLASLADVSLMSCQLSVTITKTISACVTDNASLASGLAKYGIVSHLFSLLACPNLNPVDQISVLLTLGCCTQASVEHQSQLVQCGGLPLIITLLAEDACEDVRKAATFILQTCKHAKATAFGVRGLIAKHGEDENAERLTSMESFKSSANELLHRIDLLEEKQAKVPENGQEDKDLATSAEGRVVPSLPRVLPLPLPCSQDIDTNSMVYRQNSTRNDMKAECDNSIQAESVRNLTGHESELKKMNFSEAKPSERHEWLSLEGDREPLITNSPFFKRPVPLRFSVPKEMTCTYTEDLHNPEMSNVDRFTAEEHLLARSRCAGCVLPFGKVTSRTFASLQSSCRHSCEMHKALQAATEQFRTRHCSLLLRRKYQDNSVELTRQNSGSVSATESQRSKEHWSVKDVPMTPIRKGKDKGKSCLPAHNWKKHKDISLTPLHRGGAKETLTSYSRTATETRGASKSRRHVPEDEPRTVTDHCSARRRRRKDFSLEEVHCLLSGVKRFGSSWNSILWSYPFQPGRTNVDLAKKYKQLMRGKAQDAGCK